ncbi:MAG: class I SAM-dependent methyltransferase [Burkholderiales bacterium]|nr:class I SAM-dependent methyltransferase [Burkholderiales bacterium]
MSLTENPATLSEIVMEFSRDNPSSRYRELQRLYIELHESGEKRLGLPPEQTFNGMSLMPQLARIKNLILRTGARSILDYGSGKGQQYAPMQLKVADGTIYDGVIDYWGVDDVHCYDPCYFPYSALPTARFDGVVSTDVLEHCPEQDVDWIIGEIFGFAERFVYANIACFPAKKTLPNGENAHCTIRPLAWWQERLEAATASRPGLVWEVWVQTLIQTDLGPKLQEQRIGRG